MHPKIRCDGNLEKLWELNRPYIWGFFPFTPLASEPKSVQCSKLGVRMVCNRVLQLLHWYLWIERLYVQVDICRCHCFFSSHPSDRHISSMFSSRAPDYSKMAGNKGLSSSSSSWVHRWLPEVARPYALLARLDKPIGNWLILWPCFWYAIAKPSIF
jgi:hypothetical protein